MPTYQDFMPFPVSSVIPPESFTLNRPFEEAVIIYRMREMTEGLVLGKAGARADLVTAIPGINDSWSQCHHRMDSHLQIYIPILTSLWGKQQMTG
jgi:hypothetical protein